MKIRKYLSWLRATQTFDVDAFLTGWESKYGYHDPSPLEIVARFKSVFETRAKHLSNDPISIAEIGAGYGRIAEQLVAEGFNICLIEPNTQLYKLLQKKFPQSDVFNCSAAELPKIEVEAYFSCRSLEYCGLTELFTMLRKMKRVEIPVFIWERRAAIKRIKFVNLFVGFLGLYNYKCWFLEPRLS